MRIFAYSILILATSAIALESPDLVYDDPNNIPDEVRAAMSQMEQDLESFASLAYEAQFTYTQRTFLQRANERIAGEASFDDVPYDQPPSVDGRVLYCRNKGGELLIIEPAGVSPELRRRDYANIRIYQRIGDKTTVYTGRDNIIVHGDPHQFTALPAELFMPHTLFNSHLADRWAFLYSGVRRESALQFDYLPLTVRREVLAADADQCIIAESVVFDQVRAGGQAARGTRVITLSAAQGWRPTRIERISQDRLVVAFDVKWVTLDEVDRWFPVKITATRFAQGTAPGARSPLVRSITRLEIDPSSVLFGEAAEPLEIKAEMPADAEVMDITPRAAQEGANPHPEGAVSGASSLFRLALVVLMITSVIGLAMGNWRRRQ